MANYNHGCFLPESLEAILDQSYQPEEVIVIDDGSTDNSIEVIESFMQRAPSIRLIRNDQNRGFIFSVNRGLRKASCEYVYCPAADDRPLPRLFEKSINLLAQYPQAGFCSTLSGMMNENSEYKGLVQTPIISRKDCFVPPEKALAMLRRHGSWFMGNTVIYRRAALLDAGGHIPALGPYSEAFFEQVLALKYGACFIPEPLGIWRKMESSWSAKSSANLDATIDMMRTAERLMRSTYRDLFPPDYVDDWKRRWFFSVSTSFFISSQAAQIAGLRRFLQPTSLLDRGLLASLRFSMAVERLVTRLYLFARFRRGHLWREVMRKLKHLADLRVGRSAREKRRSVQIGISKE